MSVGRRVARSGHRRSRAGCTEPDAIKLAIEMSNVIGLSAARVGCVVGIQFPGRAGGPVEVAARDRVTGEIRCWGCGRRLDGPVVGVTRFGAATGPVQIILRACDACLPPETMAVRA